MDETEYRRWMAARTYAEKQGRDANGACEYADWLLMGIRDGYIVLPAKHEPWFTTWYRFADAQVRR